METTYFISCSNVSGFMKPLKTIGGNLEFICSSLLLGVQIAAFKFTGYANMLICILKLFGPWNIGKANVRGNLAFYFLLNSKVYIGIFVLKCISAFYSLSVCASFIGFTLNLKSNISELKKCQLGNKTTAINHFYLHICIYVKIFIIFLYINIYIHAYIVSKPFFSIF